MRVTSWSEEETSSCFVFFTGDAREISQSSVKVISFVVGDDDDEDDGDETTRPMIIDTQSHTHAASADTLKREAGYEVLKSNSLSK